jgi:hypothetical protein
VTASGIPPRTEPSAPIRLLSRAVRDRLLGDHIAVVEEFAVDLPAVALTDPTGDEGQDE